MVKRRMLNHFYRSWKILHQWPNKMYVTIEFLSSLWGAAVFSWSPFDIWHSRFIYWTLTSHSSQLTKPLGFHGNITKKLVFPIPRGRHPIVTYGHFLLFCLVTDIVNTMFCENYVLHLFPSFVCSIVTYKHYSLLRACMGIHVLS